MKPLDEATWKKLLIAEGFTDFRVCPIAAGFDSGEHTHDEHTVHVILSGTLSIVDKTGTMTYKPGEKVEFPAGTRHSAFGGKEAGSMIVGVKRERKV